MKKIIKKYWFIFRKFWNFVWNDNSLLSWILSILIAFIIIKFMFYPILGLVFGTTHPIVAVVSESMVHKTAEPCIEYSNRGICLEKRLPRICGEVFNESDKFNLEEYWKSCGDWYENYNISYSNFSNYRFKNGFNKGDILVITGRTNDIEKGDVIVYQSLEIYPIIHRVVKVKDNNGSIFYETKGDANEIQIQQYYDISTGFLTSEENQYTKTILDEKNIPSEAFIGKAVFKIPYVGYVKIWFVKMLQFLRLSDVLSFTGITR